MSKSKAFADFLLLDIPLRISQPAIPFSVDVFSNLVSQRINLYLDFFIYIYYNLKNRNQKRFGNVLFVVNIIMF